MLYSSLNNFNSKKSAENIYYSWLNVRIYKNPYSNILDIFLGSGLTTLRTPGRSHNFWFSMAGSLLYRDVNLSYNDNFFTMVFLRMPILCFKYKLYDCRDLNISYLW